MSVSNPPRPASREPNIGEPIPEGPSRRVLMTTLSGSRYEIDLDQMLLRRVPDTFRVPQEGQPISADLRRDGEALQILELIRLEVGERAEFVLEPLGHPELVASTRRSTTPVVSIETAPPPDRTPR